jgi:hypothetical protein
MAAGAILLNEDGTRRFVPDTDGETQLARGSADSCECDCDEEDDRECRCWGRWIATYNCETESWGVVFDPGEPFLGSEKCISDTVAVLSGLVEHDWTPTVEPCVYTKCTKGTACTCNDSCTVADPGSPVGEPVDCCESPCECDLALPDTYTLTVHATLNRYDTNTTCTGAADCTVTDVTLVYTVTESEVSPCIWVGSSLPDSTSDAVSCDGLGAEPFGSITVQLDTTLCRWEVILGLRGDCLPQTYSKASGLSPVGSYSTGTNVCCDLLDGTSLRYTLLSIEVS